MKRLDLIFAVSLTVLAAFVGVEAYAMHGSGGRRHLVRSTGSNASTRPVEDAGEGRTGRAGRRGADDASFGVASDDEREGAKGAGRDRLLADVRARLELSSPGTYIDEVLAAHDSALARWPDRNGQPLRIWIQPIARVRDWTPAAVPIVRDAFIEWGEAGVPLNFTFVLDSASADVRVSWIDRFNDAISGKTLWSHDDRWSILEANIVLAVHHRTGEVLDTAATRAIALHEVGHLIGLDHTTDTTSIMTPRVRVKTLSPADRATARLLYALPPGPIGGSRATTR